MPSTGNTFAAFTEANYRRYALGNLLFQLGKQMVIVAVGWELYERTHSAMALGFIGLAQLIPVILLTLPAGHVADHYERRRVVIGAQGLMLLATIGLALLSWQHGPVMGFYVCLFLIGVGRAFNSPANAALLPQVVSVGNFTVNFQIASILGPALGGFLIAASHGASAVYAIDIVCILVYLLALFGIRTSHREAPVKKAMSLQTLGAGAAYVWSTPILLAAITLDMFAVLFGGAITLLPMYAKDILHVGPMGLGLLQAAPSLGAILMAFIIARYGEIRRSGHVLLWAVAGFGVVMVVFGLSRSLWLSLAMLFLSGVFDNVSVVIRQALVQLRTPDELRGRVSAINYVFIGASNELGGFESGLVAHFFGPVFSVVSGGIATLLVVLGTAAFAPSLRRMDRLHDEAASGSAG
jgi:MFS family permease